MKDPAVELIEVVKKLATDHHKGITDKYGHPYIHHLERVVDRILEMEYDVVKESKTLPLYIAAAWLHDIVEDTEITIDDLKRELPFPWELGGEKVDILISAVYALTHKGDHTYAEYIDSILKTSGTAGRIARAVKIADLLDHIAGPTPCPPSLVKRYEKSLYRLIF
ncbi:MAG TPA: hypothetical protein DCG52_05035 [Alphaproteobacteria bacterium]|nr:hypothetical protein [Alphaproteobacteria bacterium]